MEQFPAKARSVKMKKMTEQRMEEKKIEKEVQAVKERTEEEKQLPKVEELMTMEKPAPPQPRLLEAASSSAATRKEVQSLKTELGELQQVYEQALEYNEDAHLRLQEYHEHTMKQKEKIRKLRRQREEAEVEAEELREWIEELEKGKGKEKEVGG